MRAEQVDRGWSAKLHGYAELAASWVRRLTPTALVPLVVQLRTALAWSRGPVRERAREQMRFLLEETRPGADLEAAARGHVAEMVRRAEVRWHPPIVTSRRLVDFENLTAALERGHGVVLSFVHHGLYDSSFPSVAQRGVDLRMMMYPYMANGDAPLWIRQHVKVNEIGGGVGTPTDIGAKGMLNLLRDGAVLAIASDVPGTTPVRFAGRDVLGSSGAARLARAAQSPVVLMTTERDAEGPYLRFSEPLLPADFETPEALLVEILARHERAVLAWPEATDLPKARWGTPDAVVP